MPSGHNIDAGVVASENPIFCGAQLKISSLSWKTRRKPSLLTFRWGGPARIQDLFDLYTRGQIASSLKIQKFAFLSGISAHSKEAWLLTLLKVSKG
jgi:hypothetical protein